MQTANKNESVVNTNPSIFTNNDTTKSGSMQEAAFNYAKAGYKISPINPNTKKYPATKNGFKDATTDIKQIKSWWTENLNYNIGLPLALNGLVAIDVDMHNDQNGFEALEQFILRNGLSDLPATVESTTPNNGKHFVYKIPKGFNPKGKLANGVDIKYNGYIVIAPSVIDGKFYDWIEGQGLLDQEPATLPEEWVKAISIKSKPKESEEEHSFFDGDNYKYNVEKISGNCLFVQHCIEDSKILPENEWFALGQICGKADDGEEMFHKWSEDYPKYNDVETQAKIKHCIKNTKPVTCQYIKNSLGFSGCDECAHWGKINSPVKLGGESDNIEYSECYPIEPVYDLHSL